MSTEMEPAGQIASDIANQFFPVASLQNADLRRQIMAAVEKERTIARDDVDHWQHILTEAQHYWDEEEAALLQKIGVLHEQLRHYMTQLGRWAGSQNLPIRLGERPDENNDG